MATTTKKTKAPANSTHLEEPDPMPKRDERRSFDRFDVEWSVDCVADDTFLYASIANISAMGIFVKTTDPLPVGAGLVLSFAPPGYKPFKLEGKVAWINRVRPEPGNGRALRQPAARRSRAAGRGDPDDRLRPGAELRTYPVGWPAEETRRSASSHSMPTTPRASTTADRGRSGPATRARRIPFRAAALARRAAHAASTSSSSEG